MRHVIVLVLGLSLVGCSVNMAAKGSDAELDRALKELVAMPGYEAKIERIFRLRLERFDWNCSQHITPRFAEHEIAEALSPLRDRLAQLETENAQLRARLLNSKETQ